MQHSTKNQTQTQPAGGAKRLRQGRFRAYWRASRSSPLSWLFVAPLVAVYETASILLGNSFGPIRNGVELLFKKPFEALGIQGEVGILTVTGFGIALLLGRRNLRTQARFQARWLSWMVVESVFYALVIGSTIGRAARFFLQTGGQSELTNLAVRFALAIGAGAYEEILFRALLIGGGIWLLNRVTRFAGSAVLMGVVVLSSFLFAVAHYAGLASDPFTPASFVFRLLAGLAFAAVYLLRGIGIAAHSHALYNVFLILRG